MNEEVLLTKKEYEELEAKRDYLVSVRRKEVSEHLKEAKSYGDLSENAEYDAAKDEQAELEDNINKIEYQLRNARIVTEEELTGEHVNLGLAVKVKNKKTKKVSTYTVVGITNADPFKNRISNESPVGKALLGKKVGDVVEVQTAGGTMNLEILEISKE